MKKIISLFAFVGLLLAVWLGASFYSARTTGNYVTSLPALYKQNDYVHIKTIEHHQSAFSSSGKFEVRFPNLIPLFDTAPGVPGVIIQYEISNLLMPGSAGRLEWRLLGDGTLAPMLKKLFGQGSTAHGKGHIGYDGQRQSTIELSELLFKDAQTALKLTPVTGVVTWDNQTLQLKLQSNQLSARTESMVTDWRGMTIDINLSNRMLGLGKYDFVIDQGSSESSTFEGMRLTKTVELDNHRFNFVLAQTIKQYSFNKFKLADIDQTLAFRGLDQESVMSISTILRDIKDVQQMTVDERTKLSTALRNLFNKGFTLGLPQLSAKLDGGTLAGQLNIEVLKADSAQSSFSSAQRLRAKGQLILNGQGGLDSGQQATALMLGLAVKTPDGLTSNVEFSNGVIKANGRTFDVKQNLKFLDNMMNAALYP